VELDPFTLALLRSATRSAPREDRPGVVAGVPMQQIQGHGTRRGYVRLSCGHEVIGMIPKPNQRGLVIACFDCAERIPTPLELTLDRIAGARADEIAALRRALEDRARRVA
jgi:hypothetical protein